MKVYIPDKPHKWGFKLFVLASADDGFAHDFEVYSGAEAAILENEEDFGASANEVVRLARSIPSGLQHKLFSDNSYTSIPLMFYLDKRGIQTVGTVRRNRIINCPLSDDRTVMKKERGYSEAFVTKHRNLKLNCVMCKLV